jgi:very-short-patch-repair endonuclease
MSWAHLILDRLPGRDFLPQHPLGGDESMRVDFYEIPEDLILEIQGFYWHQVGVNPFQTYNERERRIRLQATGANVIYINEEDALHEPVEVLKLALRGVDISDFSMGIV